MKFSRIYILCILLFLLLVFLSEYRVPKHFRWEPTFSHTDKQPFGCYVFDSVLAASLPQGYTVNSLTIYQLRTMKQPHGILVVSDEMSMSKTDIRAAFDLAKRGHRLLLVSGLCGRQLEDTLRCESDIRELSMTLLQYAKQGLGRDTIEWVADHRYSRGEYRFYPQLIGYELTVQTDSIDCRVLSRLAGRKSDYATAVTFPMGKGSITWACTPLIFTNFGMLDSNNHEYIFRLLSETDGLPIVRTEAYQPTVHEAEQTPLRYIISQRPLRWALYLSLLAIVLAMIFGARRRQRVIPVVETPPNHLLEFVQLIGTLYFQRHDSRDELLKQSNKYKQIWKKTTKKESLSPTLQNE
jgi:hypothetical protein